MARVAVALLGMGKMGSAMALRLREHGHSITVWNRSRSKADTVQAEALPGDCKVSETATEAVEAVAPGGLVLLILSDTAACLDTIATLGDALSGRTVVNLTSGSPDDGRRVAAALPDGAELLDGAYCGPPSKARAGAGALFLSAAAGEVLLEPHRPTLSVLGELCFSGPVGASRALDYAVVDLALVCYASFLSNLEMLEREGVEPQTLYSHMGKRLATTPAAIELLHERCRDRQDGAYHHAPVATLGTIHSFFASRLPYYEAHAIPDGFARTMAGLCEQAAGGPDGAHWAADISRLQEVMRPPPAPPPPPPP